MQSIIDVEQVMSVIACIFDHFAWKRSDAPICELIFFVSVNIDVQFEEKGQRIAGKLENTGRDSGVKQVHNVESEITLQPCDIMIRTVENFDDSRVCKRGIETVHVRTELESVDEVVLLSCGNLHETDKSLKCAIIVGLQVDGNFIDTVESRCELTKCRFGFDPGAGCRQFLIDSFFAWNELDGEW